MRKPGESKFQQECTTGLRSDGCLVQKISDTMALGVPDLVIGSRTRGGMWAEAKVSAIPEDRTRPIKIGWRPGQKRFLKLWNYQPVPTCVIIGFWPIRPGALCGWIACPGHCLHWLDFVTAPIAEKLMVHGGMTLDNLKEALIEFETLLDTHGESRL